MSCSAKQLLAWGGFAVEYGHTDRYDQFSRELDLPRGEDRALAEAILRFSEDSFCVKLVTARVQDDCNDDVSSRENG